MRLTVLAMAAVSAGCFLPPICLPPPNSPSTYSAQDNRPLHRIAFGSCFHQDNPPQVWNAILAENPEVFLFLGDNVYADTLEPDVMRATYAKLEAVDGYRKLRAHCPILAMWDDHDYGYNDAGAEHPKKRDAQSIFVDFFADPPESPRHTREGVYDAKVFGPPARRVQVILLDTRYFRGPLRTRGILKSATSTNTGPYVPNDDPAATMLGEAQWSWLAEQLKIEAELRIIVSSVQLLAEDHGYEKWMNLPLERERLFSLIRSSKADGVLIVSGDRHSAELSRIDDAVGYPLFDLTSSSLNRPRTPVPESNRHRVDAALAGTSENIFFAPNFGMILIDWEKKDPTVTLRIHDDRGRCVIRHKIPISALRSRK